MKLADNFPYVSVYQDIRKAKNGNTYPVKLKVTYLRERMYLSLHSYLTKADFEKTEKGKARGALADLQRKFESEKTRANKIIEKMSTFNFTEFKRSMKIKADSNGLEWHFLNYIDLLIKQERLTTARSYQTAFNALVIFFKKRFAFNYLTPLELERFEKAYKSKGRSSATVGVYMRSLRTIYNIAIDKGDISSREYVFGRNRYVIPSVKSRKLGIPIEMVRIINSHNFQIPTHKFYRDLWMFSFHCNGMNMKDIAFLKHSDIENDILSFNRKKTERTRKQNSEDVTINLNKYVKAIIDKWGNKPIEKDTFIFPILTDVMDYSQQIKTYQQVTHMASKMVKVIAKENQWETNVCFMTARHSSGNLLQKSDQPLHVIQKALGHSDPKTTQHYLNNLEIEKMVQLSNLTELDL